MSDKSGAELQARHAEIRSHVMRIVEDIKLRQWACEQAIKGCSNDVQTNTKFFYEFATAKETSNG